MDLPSARKDGVKAPPARRASARRPGLGASNPRPRDYDAIGNIPEWRFHDMRRTATTGMAQLGIAPHIADRILNRVQGTMRGVAAVYNRHASLVERRHALDLWAELVQTTKLQDSADHDLSNGDVHMETKTRHSAEDIT